jgi:hypothetical protein
MSKSKLKDLEDRVDKFHCLELPGQPRMMHMGTSSLVSDLLKEVQRLTKLLEGKVDEPD